MVYLEKTTHNLALERYQEYSVKYHEQNVFQRNSYSKSLGTSSWINDLICIFLLQHVGLPSQVARFTKVIVFILCSGCYDA